MYMYIHVQIPMLISLPGRRIGGLADMDTGLLFLIKASLVFETHQRG